MLPCCFGDNRKPDPDRKSRLCAAVVAPNLDLFTEKHGAVIHFEGIRVNPALCVLSRSKSSAFAFIQVSQTLPYSNYIFCCRCRRRRRRFIQPGSNSVSAGCGLRRGEDTNTAPLGSR